MKANCVVFSLTIHSFSSLFKLYNFSDSFSATMNPNWIVFERILVGKQSWKIFAMRLNRSRQNSHKTFPV